MTMCRTIFVGLALTLAGGCGHAPPAARETVAEPVRRRPPEGPMPDGKACVGQVEQVERATTGKDPQDRLKQAERLVATLRPWPGTSTVAKPLAACRERAERALRALATVVHRQAQQTREQAAYEQAERLYRLYLEIFSDGSDGYTLAFYHAECLYQLERWVEAAEAYARVAKQDLKGKYAKEAAYAAVICHKNALNLRAEAEMSPRRPSGSPSFKPEPIPGGEKKLLEAFATYLKLVPDAPERVNILYRQARIYYEHNHYDRAIALFSVIVTRHPGHELAVYAANLLLDSLNILKRYDELGRWVDQLLKQPALAKGELGETLTKLKLGFGRRTAEELVKAGKHRECGERYLQLAQSSPANPRWTELMYNAGICFEAAKLFDRAIAAYQVLIRVRPQSPLARRALRMLGQIHEAQGRASDAALCYERFARLYPGEAPVAPDALERAIGLRLKQGEVAQARADAALFAKYYGARKRFVARAARLIFEVGPARGGQPAAALRYYTDYLKRWGKDGGVELEVRAEVRVGIAQWQRSCPVKATQGACIRTRSDRRRERLGVPTRCGPETVEEVAVVERRRAVVEQARAHLDRALARSGPGIRDDAARLALAWAGFHRAEEQLEAFLRVGFPKKLDFSSQQPHRARRSSLALASYLKVIEQRQAGPGVAAMARIGQLYSRFADEIGAAPVGNPPLPRGLKGKKARREFLRSFVDVFCDTVEDRAEPLRQKARQAFEACVQKARELKVDSAWSRLCAAELGP
jgi:tetratricopeptide (TPR) repeat protein